MVKMSERIINLINEWHTFPVATVGKDGKPNVAGKSGRVFDAETIIWGELYFMQSYENLKQNPVASICVWEDKPPFRAYKINGRVEIHEGDRLAASLDNMQRKGHKSVGAPVFPPRRDMMAAIIFKVEEIYDQTPSLEAGGKRIS